MKVLHLVAGELNRGAARGAYWLHHALRDLGVDSTILTNAKDDLGDESVISLANSTAGKLKFAILHRIGLMPLKAYRNKQPLAFNTGFGGIDFTRHPAYASADLVHLHWVNGLVRTRALRNVKKPLVWTLRDMWPLTGGCHHALECDRFTRACGRCPQLGSSRERDLTRFVLRRKRASLPERIRLVGMSHWLSDCARRSALFRGAEVSTIGNNVDTQMFSPLPMKVAREALGLDQDKKIVLLGALDVASAYKGLDLFLEALESHRDSDIHILIFGKSSGEIPASLGMTSTSIGFLSDTISLRLAYSAADVFVAPSRAESFGKTLVEAMSCGTPVVCFDATGPKDIVEHRVSGYRARPFDPLDLAHGIRWVLDQPPDTYQGLCLNARERVLRCFDSKVIARQYKALYGEMLTDADFPRSGSV